MFPVDWWLDDCNPYYQPLSQVDVPWTESGPILTVHRANAPTNSNINEVNFNTNTTANDPNAVANTHTNFNNYIQNTMYRQVYRKLPYWIEGLGLG